MGCKLRIGLEIDLIPGAVRGMISVLREVWRQDEGQDVAEYAVMLAVMLTIAVGTVRLIGSHASDVFSSIGSSIQ